MTVTTQLDQQCIDTLRFLSVDMVQKANSGHPGLPLGAAPMAYVLSDAPDGKRELILLASGSEVSLIVAAAERLQQQGVAVRCVSMPSWELFEALPQAEREAVLPPSVSARLAVELGVPQGWDRYVGARGDMLGVERFGASAPVAVLLREYGFTVDNVCARAMALLAAPAQASGIASGTNVKETP